MKKLTVFILSASFFIFKPSYSQNNFDQVEIKETQIGPNTYFLEGAGGNLGLFLGSTGAILIDDQYAPLSEKISKKIAELSGKKANYILNTHWHGDHTGGNENFANAGAVIVAHKNVRERMSKEQERGENKINASPEAAWPVISFGEDMQLYVNGSNILMIHVHNAHTDGDALVWLPDENVLHMGDCFFHKRFPFIDLESGGSVDGVIKANEAALMLVNEDTKIIPGHGPVATKSDLEKNLKFLQEIKERILEHVNSGRGMESMRTEQIVKGYEDWAWAFIDAKRLTETFFKSLSE